MGLDAELLAGVGDSTVGEALAVAEADVVPGALVAGAVVAGAAAGEPHPDSKTAAQNATEPNVPNEALWLMSPSP
ncbi:hypothetical protein [Arthrobacter sp. C9C5]|uniref:hypothetical protein n=1 Tax=Arthrobacter sp. C9C5 TaxID=2735267 RepID=UPI00158510EF|nr:hypothetical protein [Arthrobacter sp. C9C5]NUU32626.1 hypothetical protein [Arthrobacter sp. C9C5]